MAEISAPGLNNRVARFMIERPAVSIAIIGFSITLVLLLTLFISKQVIANDFGVYWRAANEPISAVYLPRTENPFPYPPTMLLWIAPLSLAPLPVAFVLWIVASVGAYVATCRPYLDKGALALALCCPAMVHCLATGQVSAMIASLLIYAFATPHRNRAGLALAIIASIKPQFVLFAPVYLLALRDWRAFLWAASGFVTLIALSVLFFGLASWTAWIASMSNFHDVLLAKSVLAVSITPAGQAEFFGLPPTPFLVVGAIIGLLLVTMIKAKDPVSAAALVAGASLFAAPYALVYDLLPLAPFLARMTMRNGFAAAVSLGMSLGPLPLVLAAYSLWKDRRQLGRTGASAK